MYVQTQKTSMYVGVDPENKYVCRCRPRKQVCMQGCRPRKQVCMQVQTQKTSLTLPLYRSACNKSAVMYRCVRCHAQVCQRSCIDVLEVMYRCVRGHVQVCQRSCIGVLEVMHRCVRGHVQGIDFASFYDLSIAFWKCFDIVLLKKKKNCFLIMERKQIFMTRIVYIKQNEKQNKQYPTVGTNSIEKSQKKTKSSPLAHKYMFMAVHFLRLEHALP